MSEETELRDRIAKAIDRGFNNGADLNDYEAETQAMAQAIIDDLGLTVETRRLHVGATAPNGVLIDKRVVGRWERQ